MAYTPPTRAPQLLQQEVLRGIHTVVQEYIQAATLACLDDSIGLPSDVLRLNLREGKWTIFDKRSGSYLVCVLLSFTDGHVIERRWRVSEQSFGLRGEQLFLNLRSRVLFTRRLDMCTLDGRAGGHGRRSGGSVISTRASRPAIGRAFKRRRA